MTWSADDRSMDHTQDHARPASRGDGGDVGAAQALDLAAAELCRRTHAACCWISAATAGDAEVLAAHARRGPPARPAGTRWRIADVPPAMQALATRRRVSLSGSDDPRLTAAQRASWYGNGDGTSVVVVPLLADDTVVGFVELADSRPRDLSLRLEEQDALLRLVTDLVAQRRRLVAAERRAADLALILDADIEAQSRTAGSEQVLRVVARRLATLCRAPLVDISSVERDRLHTVVSWNRHGFNHEVEGTDYALSDWPVTRAAVADGRAEIASSTSDDPRLDASAVAEMKAWGVGLAPRPAPRRPRRRDRRRRGLRQ